MIAPERTQLTKRHWAPLVVLTLEHTRDQSLRVSPFPLQTFLDASRRRDDRPSFVTLSCDGIRFDNRPSFVTLSCGGIRFDNKPSLPSAVPSRGDPLQQQSAAADNTMSVPRAFRSVAKKRRNEFNRQSAPYHRSNSLRKECICIAGDSFTSVHEQERRSCASVSHMLTKSAR